MLEEGHGGGGGGFGGGGAIEGKGVRLDMGAIASGKEEPCRDRVEAAASYGLRR